MANAPALEKETIDKVTKMIVKEIVKKPYFDVNGNFYMPKDIKFGGQLNPKLNPKEWFFLILTIADKRHLSQKKQKKLFDILIGSKSSIYRMKKNLKEKGYL